ncbi:Exosome complex component RRP43 [Vitis vinifera]|uniref:Ribosomal RNA-processing protein 43 n=2 Tax=Vitis vinifera TaxID=29760 RepID=A0A438BZT2_VITVI|nr:Exosome complex component RRP43 [Vitis vinifera]
MVSANVSGDLSSEMEVDAFRRLFPLRYHERFLLDSIRPDARPLGRARDTSLALGAVASADGSALAKIGCTTMLAAVKMEVMTPPKESPDEGSIAIEFYMPPICSPLVRPGRPAEEAPVVSKQLSDTILRHVNVVTSLSHGTITNADFTKAVVPYWASVLKAIWDDLMVPNDSGFCCPIISLRLFSGMINLKELSLVSGKAAWMAYLDIYCLDADGSLFDAALLAAVAAFSHSHTQMIYNETVNLPLRPGSIVRIPVVSLNEEGRVVVVSEENEEGKSEKEPVNKGKRKLTLSSLPFSLTCILHKNYILADPTAEEESIMETLVTVVLDSSGQLVSLYKPGGPVLAYASAVQDCIALTRQRVKELKSILNEAISDMEVD